MILFINLRINTFFHILIILRIFSWKFRGFLDRPKSVQIIHVVDLAYAHVKAIVFLAGKFGSFETINIGTGKGSSVLEIISAFESETGQKLKWKYGKRRSGDVTEIFANATKAKNILEWEAKLSIKDAVIDAWNWEKKLIEHNEK